MCFCLRADRGVLECSLRVNTSAEADTAEGDVQRKYITGWLNTEAGKVPVVSVRLSRADKLGSVRVRFAVERMNYTVDPGLYAVGSPGRDSFVFVSANYKLSFDALRQELGGLDAWILVLDTRGINVWCAAGKGTFGTSEIVKRIEATGLEKIVSHRKLIVPQLGATGVAAHEVKRLSGFAVTYGPVRASDIKTFIEGGMKASREMRRVTFPLLDRAKLVPAEVVGSLKYLLGGAVAFLVLSGLSRSGYSSRLLLDIGLPSTLNLAIAYVAGTGLGLALLPWLPGRAFSLKGLVLGLALSVVLYFAGLTGGRLLEAAAWTLLVSVACSFIVLNLTGTSTYTSLSGVKKEMRIAVPLQIVGAVLGFGFWVAGRFV